MTGSAALLWFTEALSLDQDHPEHEHAHRLRIGAILARCPTLVQGVFSRRSDPARLLQQRRHPGPHGQRRRLRSHLGGPHRPSRHPAAGPRQPSPARRLPSRRPDGCHRDAGRPGPVLVGEHRPTPCRARQTRRPSRLVSPLATTGDSCCRPRTITRRVSGTAAPASRLIPGGTPARSRMGPLAVTGAQAVTACADGTAQVWDVGTGAAGAKLLGHQGPVLQVCFHPDGRRVLTAGADGEIRLHDAGDRQAAPGPR